MSRDSDARSWMLASQTLGLSLMHDTIGNRGLTDFGMMRGALAPVVALSPHNWMVGMFEGREALVSYYFADGGSSADTHETYAFARVDPPLFLGLDVDRRFFLSGAPKILGVPIFDDRFILKSFLPERGRALLWPGRAPPLAEMLVETSAHGYHPRLVDTFASVHVDKHEENPGVLADMLRYASRLASALEVRRTTLGDTNAEVHERNEWARFAESERMTFDAKQRAIAGKFRGHDTFVSTKTIPDRAFSHVQVGLPVGTGLDVTITLETALSRFGNMLGFSDLEIGDASFDREFRINAEPKYVADARVRALFGSPASRETVAAIVRKYEQFRLHDRFAFVAAPPARTGEALRVVLDELAAFVEAASAPNSVPPPQGPYRR